MKTENFTILANLIDIFKKEIYPAEVVVENGFIKKISRTDKPVTNYILPGFTDAHIHVESSMLIPSEFARLAVLHGTVATINDPHEIANVMGVAGVNYMIENGKKVPFYFNFGAPSCVPATVFETAGAAIDAKQIDELLARKEIKYLTEMMNYPGVLMGEEQVLEKISHAKKHNKPVDGHAPGLIGDNAIHYIKAGISTDHECFTYEEALHKLKHGMKILIREGSAAKNFEALIPLLNDYTDNIMFCSDDKHPNDLVRNHIDALVKRALAKGIDLFKILQVACLNPVFHYGLDHGLLREGDPADFIVIDSPKNFKILQTYIKGELVAENGKSFIKKVAADIINDFNCKEKNPADFLIPASSSKKIKVIEALNGQLITRTSLEHPKVAHGYIESDVEKDVLKLTVVNRYKEAKPALAFIKNFGLKSGAIASCVGHDSHNIIAVGTNDKDICEAVNLIVRAKGGLSVADGEKHLLLPLPVAGIMTNADAYEVADLYTQIDAAAKKLGTQLDAPFMTLSFMALLVIPQLKLSDLGLFDGGSFKFVELGGD